MKFILLLVPLLTIAAPNDGRFQIHFHKDIRRDTTMIDTHTGKMWREICLTEKKKPSTSDDDCVVRYWKEELVMGVSFSDKKLDDFIAYYDKRKKQEKEKREKEEKEEAEASE